MLLVCAAREKFDKDPPSADSVQESDVNTLVFKPVELNDREIPAGTAFNLIGWFVLPLAVVEFPTAV